jgi:hypothetical protein
MSANVHSPVILVSNWLNETKRFFNDRDLRAKEWSAEAFTKDTRESTIWLVKISQLRNRKLPFYKYFWDTENPVSDVTIASTWSDEAHIFGRSTDSQQNQILRQFTMGSKFNVLISGTLFPLGPSTDAINVLTSLGGDLSATPSKWQFNPRLQRALRRLLSQQSWTTDTSLLALRFLIAPFVLRRTTNSTWNGRYIVEKSISRPVPKVLQPQGDEYSKAASSVYVKRRFQNGKGPETDHAKAARADAQKAYAWTPLFEKANNESAGLRQHQRQPRIESIIRHALAQHDWPRSSRLILLVKTVRSIVKAGERFVIVSDRIFLLTFIYWVSPSECVFRADVVCRFYITKRS